MPGNDPQNTSSNPLLAGRILLGQMACWARKRPLEAMLAAGIVGTLVFFLGLYKSFSKGDLSVAEWAWSAWNPENNQEHARFVVPIFLGLICYHSRKLVAAPKAPTNWGLLVTGLGIVLYILSVRTLQPRLALVCLPILVLGGALFLWGRPVARILAFPCCFLLFMVPIGGLVQGTVSLQLLVSWVCNILAGLIGVSIEASGTTIRSLDGSFNFEIAEGCSGIRSLMAMTTVTALYVHFAQRVFWKKAAVFCGSVVFAVVGNIGRIFTVILVAKFISPSLAGGLYHDYSGLVFFPIAVSAMLSFSNLLRSDLSRFKKLLMATEQPSLGDAKSGADPVKPSSYDY